MLKRVAEYCTSSLISRGAAEESKRAVFVYGFQLFFSTASSVLSMLIISAVSGNVFYGILYLTVFLSLRITANGYHADTFLGCFLLTNSLFLLYLSAISFIPPTGEPAAAMVPAIICMVYIWIKAPIEHPNHKLSAAARRKNRMAARVIVTIDIIALALLYVFDYGKAAQAVSAALYIVVLMMLVKNKHR